jgi:hypothetical protein
MPLADSGGASSLAARANHRKIGWSLVQHDDAGLAGQRLGRRGNVLGEDQLEGTGTLDGVNSLDLLLLLTGNQLAAQRVD